MIHTLPEKLQHVAVLPLRLALGVIFFVHGADKLFGWYGGGGIKETIEMMTSLGLPQPMIQAYLAGGAEMLGGILVFLGLFTRFGGLLIASTMAVAIATVHLHNGVLGRDGGFECPLADMAGALTLMITGAQGLSLDSFIQLKLKK